MKIRLRLQKRTVIATIPEGEAKTLGNLKSAARELFAISECSLSLNGKDSLDGEEDAPLSDLGIVSGDLLHVLTTEDVPVPPEQKGTPERKGTPEQKVVACQKVQQTADSTCCSRKQPNSSPDNEPRTTKSDTAMASTSSNTGAGADVAPVAMEIEDEECIQDEQVNRYLYEPMLVQDSTAEVVPQCLEAVYCDKLPCDSHDAVARVLHVLMHETGFRSQSDKSARQDSIEGKHLISIPSNWKKSSHYEVTYLHLLCPDVVFRLSMVPMGSLLFVHGQIVGSEPDIHLSLQIKTGLFINSLQETARETYCHVPRLARLFKDAIAHPLLHKTQAELGLHASNTLLGLMYELQVHCLSFLDAKSLCRMSGVCLGIQDQAREPSLWRKHYLREFGRRRDNDLSQDWFKLYKDKYLQRCEIRERMRQYTMIAPPWLDRPNPPLPFAPVYPPGFVGGDYDRDPLFPGLIGPIPGPQPMRPRFDPIGPHPNMPFRPGQGGGMFDNASNRRNNPGGGGFNWAPRF